MGNTEFMAQIGKGSQYSPEDNVFDSVWNQYERVILNSLLTSFGLDPMMFHDQTGGDVDTIQTVRDLGTFKNSKYQEAWDNREPYNSAQYHGLNPNYRATKEAAKAAFDAKVASGDRSYDAYMDDAYVPGNKVQPYHSGPRGEQAQLDHVVSAKSIYDDKARILSGRKGEDLANMDSNLRFTNAALNDQMKDKSVEEYIAWCEEHPDKVNYAGEKGQPLPDSVKRKLRYEYMKAHKAYDAQIARDYYTNPQFYQDTALAAAKTGVKMGIRQVLGLVFIEIYYSAKDELQALPDDKDLKDCLAALVTGVQKGLEKAKSKWKELLNTFFTGGLSGVVASLSTTICNIFTTISKNVVRCVRQLYASVVEAGKVLLFNPENLMFGDRIKKACVIMATGASVLVGTSVGALIETALLATPFPKALVPFVTSFCSSLVSGLLSCTLLIFLDRSKFMRDLVDKLNQIPTMANNFKLIADEFERIAAEMARIDIDKFVRDTTQYDSTADRICNAKSDQELNEILLEAYKKFGINIPWTGDFNSFMGNRNNHLVFMVFS